MNSDEEIQIMTSEPDDFKAYFKNIWKFRALIWVFAKRDLKVKYSQTVIGLGWTLLQPLTALFIFTFFFGFLLKWQTDGIAYPIYVLSGLLGWNFFTYIAQSGSLSIQESGELIKKIYFPKSILPFSKVIVALVELLFSLAILVPLMLYYDQLLSWKIVFLPFVLLFNASCGLSLVFWIAAFAYKKRDAFHLLPYVVTFGIWLTPVFFGTNILPTKFQFVIDFNPMAHVINSWRWMLFDTIPFNISWVISFVIVFFVCILGMFYYNTKENKFSDFI